MSRNVVKISANLPEDAVQALRNIADAEGITVTEVLRRAISTQKFVHDTVSAGSKLLVEDPTEKSLRQVVFR